MLDEKTKKTLGFVPGLVSDDDPLLAKIRANVSSHNQQMKNARMANTTRKQSDGKTTLPKTKHLEGAVGLRPTIQELKDQWTSENPGKTLPNGLELDLNSDDE